MIQLGAPASETRAMNLDDIFFSRLKLMIIMAKAYLSGCPLGECRRNAMHRNASHLEAESMELVRSRGSSGENDGQTGVMSFDFVFYQRVKLLAVMVKAVARGFPMGEHRRAAMLENLDAVCRTLMFSDPPESMAVLKVA